MADIAELQIDLLRSEEDPQGRYSVEMTGYGAPISGIRETCGFSLPATIGADAAYGKDLYAALFKDPRLRTAFEQVLAQTVGRRRPLRVRLYIRDDPGGVLARHQWEMLHDPQSDSWLFTNELLHFRRHVKSPFEQDVDTASFRTSGLQALVVIANPADLHDTWEVGDPEIGGRPTRIQVKDEYRLAKLGLQSLGVTPATLISGHGRRVTARALADALNSGPVWDVVYLVCHGGFMHNGPEGSGFYLLLEGDDRPSDLLPVDRLVSDLKNQVPARRPRLFVLVSCQSGATRMSENGDSLVGVGRRLVEEAGVAAAIAMQGNFTMDTAEIFLRAFFESLRMNGGNVEMAMASARSCSSTRMDWYIPVLYSGGRWDGELWPDISTVAGTVAHIQLARRRLYVAHPAKISEAETVLVESVKEHIGSIGHDVLASEPTPLSRDRWGQRAILDLGTCDGGIIVFTEDALTNPKPEFLDEIRVLGWRTALEKEFSVSLLLVRTSCTDALQDEAWRLACPIPGSWKLEMFDESQVADIKHYLEERHTGPKPTNPWSMQDLRTSLMKRIKKLDIERDRLAAIVGDLQRNGSFHALSNQVDAIEWWANALLCKGPVALIALVKSIPHLIDPGQRDGLRELRDAVKPFWVDLTSASAIPALLLETDGSDDVRKGSFHLSLQQVQEIKMSDLEDVAEWYVKRAFGFCGDSPQRTLYFDLRGDISTMLEALHAELAAKLGVDSSSRADVQDYWLGESDLDIKERVAEKAGENRPVVLDLQENFMLNRRFLKAVRERFGPIAFFFLGSNRLAASEAGIYSLDPPLNGEDYLQARNSLRWLRDELGR